METSGNGYGTAEVLGPEFDAGLWEFIAEVAAGRGEPGPQLFKIACCLVGMWQGTVAELYMRISGAGPGEAAEYVAELISAQRILCGSLAAPEAPGQEHLPEMMA
jgi:hypothetical protein